MRINIGFKLRTVLFLETAVILFNVLSVFLYLDLDRIVTVDLYNYGLIFSNEWASQYSLFGELLLFLISFSTFSALSSIILGISYSRSLKKVRNIAASAFLIAAAALICLAIFLLTRIDYIVNVELYRYQLQFSSQWAGRYWADLNMVLALESIAVSATVFTAFISLLASYSPFNAKPAKLFVSLMIVGGIASILLSVESGSLILAFIGLGLVLWAAILFYVGNGQYTRKSVFDVTTSSLLSHLEEILRELNYEGETYYLPPKYLVDPGRSKACILKQKESAIPSPEDLQNHLNELVLESPQAILITPLGAEFVGLFERKLNTDFMKVDIYFLQKNFPKLLVDEFEMAQSVEINYENGRFSLVMKSSIFDEIYRRSTSYPNVLLRLGTPFSSGIACVLAKVAGKPVVLMKDQLEDDHRTIVIECRVIEE